MQHQFENGNFKFRRPKSWKFVKEKFVRTPKNFNELKIKSGFTDIINSQGSNIIKKLTPLYGFFFLNYNLIHIYYSLIQLSNYKNLLSKKLTLGSEISPHTNTDDFCVEGLDWFREESVVIYRYQNLNLIREGNDQSLVFKNNLIKIQKLKYPQKRLNLFENIKKKNALSRWFQTNYYRYKKSTKIYNVIYNSILVNRYDKELGSLTKKPNKKLDFKNRYLRYFYNQIIWNSFIKSKNAYYDEQVGSEQLKTETIDKKKLYTEEKHVTEHDIDALVELQKRIKNASLDYLKLPVKNKLRNKLRKVRNKLANMISFRVKLKNNYTAIVKITQGQTVETLMGFKKKTNQKNQCDNIYRYLEYLNNKFEQDFVVETGCESGSESGLYDYDSSTLTSGNESFVFDSEGILNTLPQLTKTTLTNYLDVVSFTDETRGDVLLSTNNFDESVESGNNTLSKIDVTTDCDGLTMNTNSNYTQLSSGHNFNYFDNADTTELETTTCDDIAFHKRVVETNPTVRSVLEDLYETLQQTYSTNITLLVDNKPMRHFLNYKFLLKTHNRIDEKKDYRISTLRNFNGTHKLPKQFNWNSILLKKPLSIQTYNLTYKKYLKNFKKHWTKRIVNNYYNSKTSRINNYKTTKIYVNKLKKFYTRFPKKYYKVKKKKRTYLKSKKNKVKLLLKFINQNTNKKFHIMSLANKKYNVPRRLRFKEYFVFRKMYIRFYNKFLKKLFRFKGKNWKYFFKKFRYRLNPKNVKKITSKYKLKKKTIRVGYRAIYDKVFVWRGLRVNRKEYKIKNTRRYLMNYLGIFLPKFRKHPVYHYKYLQHFVLKKKLQMTKFANYRNKVSGNLKMAKYLFKNYTKKEKWKRAFKIFKKKINKNIFRPKKYNKKYKNKKNRIVICGIMNSKLTKIKKIKKYKRLSTKIAFQNLNTLYKYTTNSRNVNFNKYSWTLNPYKISKNRQIQNLFRIYSYKLFFNTLLLYPSTLILNDKYNKLFNKWYFTKKHVKCLSYEIDDGSNKVKEPDNFRFFNYLMTRIIEQKLNKRVLIKLHFNNYNLIPLDCRIILNIWTYKVGRFSYIFNNAFNLHVIVKLFYYVTAAKDLNLLMSIITKTTPKVAYSKHRRFFKFIIFMFRAFYVYLFQKFGVKGMQFEFKGKISVTGNARKRKMYYKLGKPSRSTYTFSTKYIYKTVSTHMGVLGIKAWIFY